MQDYMNGAQGNKYFVTSNQYDFQVLENPATPLAQNINLNITNIIEDVKRQRLDIIKLNNELKNSRSIMDRKNLEEMRGRQDLSIIVRTLRSEKEQLTSEIRTYREASDRMESRLSEKDSTISDLRSKNSDYLKQLNDRQKEIDDLKYSLARMKGKLEDAQSTSRSSFENKEAFATMEAKATQYFEKFKSESQKTTRLQKDFTGLQENYDALFDEKDKVAQKLNQYIEANTKMKKEINVLRIDSNSGNRNLEELQEDLRLFTELKDKMEYLIVDIQKTEEWEEGEIYDDDD
jgi:chromosome segregation ATPase